MKFVKMHGLGNDFIILDGISQALPENLPDFSRAAADRHFGIGCDQVIVIEEGHKAPFRLSFYNADGSQAEMCGNGTRCAVRYLKSVKLLKAEEVELETRKRRLKAWIRGDRVRVDMGKPLFKTADWYFDEERVIGKEVLIEGEMYRITLVSIGNPHCVIFQDLAVNFEIQLAGPKIEKSEYFPNSINVEFIKVINDDEIRMRVWERGTGETLACGSGATAAAVASNLNGFTGKKVLVHLNGGDLEVEWAEDGHAYQTGPAEFVFEGKLKDLR
ncbi:MAG: diaminopimelate epimerase [Candidatus Wallbacteria bacterium]|nr:diaminopimelate epimerase [Candidatus Wallbacteria bacterium]